VGLSKPSGPHSRVSGYSLIHWVSFGRSPESGSAVTFHLLDGFEDVVVQPAVLEVDLKLLHPVVSWDIVIHNSGF